MESIKESVSDENREDEYYPKEKKTQAQRRWMKVSNFFKTLKLLKIQETKKLEKDVST